MHRRKTDKKAPNKCIALLMVRYLQEQIKKTPTVVSSWGYNILPSLTFILWHCYTFAVHAPAAGSEQLAKSFEDNFDWLCYRAPRIADMQTAVLDLTPL